MTVTLGTTDLSARLTVPDRRECIVLALVNNMPDGALQTTEQQFAELLGAAGAAWDVRLRLFSFPELIRSEGGKAYVAKNYERIDDLWSGEFDGLIITGAEPRTTRLSAEVYWSSLTRLIDWANDSGTPTVFSCLAAHAAVLHLDGIERVPLSDKVSGVFRCAKVRDHSLLARVPGSWRIPHSRHNTLDPERLAAAGYEILSLSENAGVDAFALERRAPFVFYQGHPEYDPGALFREYRRDVGRFLSGTAERYPEMPRSYFDDDAARAFIAFRTRALRNRSRKLLEDFPSGGSRERPPHLWREVGVRLYANWLARVAAQRRSIDTETLAAEAGSVRVS